MKKYNLVQVGTFDVENFGDLLFPIVFEHEIKQYLNLDKLYLFSPNGGTMPFFNRHVYSTSTLGDFCSKNSVDGIIVGGGDTVRLDGKIVQGYSESFVPSFSVWQYPIFVAEKHNIPVLFNSPGVPIDFGVYQKIVEDTLTIPKYLSVRDNNAKEILTDTKASSVHTTLDTVTLIDDVYPKEKLNPIFQKLKKRNHIEDKFIVIQVNDVQVDDANFVNSIVDLAKCINEKHNLQVVFSPIGYIHNDLHCLEKIYAKIPERNTIIREKMHPETMLTLFSHSSGFVGTSLHGLVTSNAYHVPVLAIDTQGRNKMEGFIRLCNFENRIVKDVSKISEIFNQFFFETPNYSKYNEERKKVRNHFKTIASHIINQDTNKDPDLFIKILNDFYEISDPNSLALTALYYTDTQSAVRLILPDKNGSYKVPIVRNAHKIDLAFRNHFSVAINSVTATSSNKKNIPFVLHNLAVKKSSGSIYLDPIITFSDLDGIKTLNLTIDFELVPQAQMAKSIKEFSDSNYGFSSAEEFREAAKQYRDIVDSKFWKLSTPIRKLLSKLHR